MALRRIKRTEPTKQFYADAVKVVAEFAKGGGARQHCPSCGGLYRCVDYGSGVRIWCVNMCGLKSTAGRL